MDETHQHPSVLNVHWFGDIESLPENVVYIGRPGPYGNTFSSISGKYTREEAVALHRVDLYKNLIENPDLFANLKAELLGRDLACWCKHKKRVVCCHGDNYLHILKPSIINRLYDKSVLFYLMEDLRAALGELARKITDTVPDKEWLWLYITYTDLRVDISYTLIEAKQHKAAIRSMCILVAYLIVDVEAAVIDDVMSSMNYRLVHALWIVQYFFTSNTDRSHEPKPPGHGLRKPKSKRKE